MISMNPVESYGELVERFPGIDELAPEALGRFAFHAARNQPPEEFEYHDTGEPRQSLRANLDVAHLYRDIQTLLEADYEAA